MAPWLIIIIAPLAEDSSLVASMHSLQLLITPAAEYPTFSSGCSGHLYSHVHKQILCAHVHTNMHTHNLKKKKTF